MAPIESSSAESTEAPLESDHLESVPTTEAVQILASLVPVDAL